MAQAGAQDSHHQRDQTKAQLAQVNGQLSLALASDTKVQADVARLDAAYMTQVSRADQAQLAKDVAQSNLSQSQRALASATQHLDASHRRLVDAVIQDYMTRDTQAGSLGAVLGSTGLEQAVVREAYLKATQTSAGDSLDAFRIARRSEDAAAKVLAMALGQAQSRADLEQAAAASLRQVVATQQAAHAELARRISGLRTESADLAGQEQGLEALIASQDAAAQGALARQAQAAGSQGSAGSGVGQGFAPGGGVGTLSGLIWPIAGVVTSEFGPRWGGFHPGIDVAGPYGTPIHAAKDGVVIFAGWEGGYGNFVLIDHGGGIVTGYAHQSQVAVAQGQDVRQGQVIGYEGSTGDSTGPHVHFEVRINGAAQDPRGHVGGGP